MLACLCHIEPIVIYIVLYVYVQMQVSIYPIYMYLKHLREGFIKVQFLWQFLKYALCQLVNNLVVCLSSAAAGSARLNVQDGVDKIVSLLSLYEDTETLMYSRLLWI